MTAIPNSNPPEPVRTGNTVSPWQPIDTAPTETAVLTYRGVGLMAVAENIPDYRGGFEWCCVDGAYLVNVTHWMPLPDPPANTEAVTP